MSHVRLLLFVYRPDVPTLLDPSRIQETTDLCVQ